MLFLRHKTFWVKKIILLLATFFIAFTAKAEEDAFCTWTSVTFDKSFGKWSVGLMSQYRHKIHKGISDAEQFIARPRGSYKVRPWFTVRYQMDFASSSKGFNISSIPELTFSHKVGDFTLAFRQRSVTTWWLVPGTNSTVLRSRAKVDYAIPKTPLTAHFSAEPYWCNFSNDSFLLFQKIRWHAGFSIKVLDNLTILPEYVCQAYYNDKGKYARRTYDDHVIHVSFIVKL